MSLPMYVQTNWAILNEMVAGDTSTVLDLTCYDLQGNIIDLTTVSSASLRFKIGSGALSTVAMTIVAPASQGRVTYQFKSGDTLNQSGLCQYEVILKDASGNPLKTQLTPGLFRVRAPFS